MRRYFMIPALSVLIISCSKEQPAQQKTDDVKTVFTLSRQDVSKILTLPAELLPYERAEINARVEGYVQRVLVDIGDKVTKGDVLVIIDAPEVAARYAEANARYAETDARYRASLDKFKRVEEASRQQGVIADAELIGALNQMKADSAAWASAKSAARSFGQQQQYLTMRAPFTGVVTNRLVDAGDLVGSTGKTSLLTVERPDKLRLRVHVPEAYVNSVPAEDKITFTADAVVNKIFTARLARKSGSISQATRTELWEYEYDNDDGALKPGMYTTVKLQLNRRAGSFVVPHAAVVTTLERKFVVRVRGGKTEWVDVRDGIAQDSGMEIFGPLQAGDTLLARGSDELKPGSAVKTKLVAATDAPAPNR